MGTAKKFLSMSISDKTRDYLLEELLICVSLSESESIQNGLMVSNRGQILGLSYMYTWFIHRIVLKDHSLFAEIFVKS